MKICILQPDYSTTNVDYKNYDPPRNLASLLPGHEVTHLFLNKLTTYKQLKVASKQGFDIFVNLCEGYLEWEVPSIDVIYSLDLLNLPYTGPSVLLYDPRKPLMKYAAYCAGVSTPAYAEISDLSEVKSITENLSFPLFIKPSKAGDSLGIDRFSLVKTEAQIQDKVSALLTEYDSILVEEYIDGREFTVLVAASAGKSGCIGFKPLEYVFKDHPKYKTYAHKTSELIPENNVPCNDPHLGNLLKDAACKIFTAFEGVGYARIDFRLGPDGSLFFLEINFACSLFYEHGFEGSADYILKFDPIGKMGFLNHIIEEGISRWRKKQKKYLIRGNALSGFGIFALQDLEKDAIIFDLESRSHNIVTRRFVENHWNDEQKMNFRHYAFPISEEVYILWSDNPESWAPQNHSCNPNTEFSGLNVVALRNISKGDELTIDYSGFLNDNLEPFECNCGDVRCRKIITGSPDNSITLRETRMP